MSKEVSAGVSFIKENGTEKESSRDANTVVCKLEKKAYRELASQHGITEAQLKAHKAFEEKLVEDSVAYATEQLIPRIEQAIKNGDDPNPLTHEVRIQTDTGSFSTKVRARTESHIPGKSPAEKAIIDGKISVNVKKKSLIKAEQVEDVAKRITKALSK
jgi:hypothetical protein